MKQKLAYCYIELIERMGSKISNFRDIGGVIKMVATFLTEGAVEVRNVAKRGLFSL